MKANQKTSTFIAFFAIVLGVALSARAIPVRPWVELQLVRKAPFGAIKGHLYFYGARDLVDGFESSPIQDASVSFGADDPTFVTISTTDSVTQTATFSFISYKFFNAAIHAYLPDNGDEPWEEPGEEEP